MIAAYNKKIEMMSNWMVCQAIKEIDFPLNRRNMFFVCYDDQHTNCFLKFTNKIITRPSCMLWISKSSRKETARSRASFFFKTIEWKKNVKGYIKCNVNGNCLSHLKREGSRWRLTMVRFYYSNQLPLFNKITIIQRSLIHWY